MRSGRPFLCLLFSCLLPLVVGSTASAETGGISVRIVPGGTFAAKKVTGSYEGLGPAFGDVVKWLGENAGSVTVAGPAQSVFRDDPKALPAEKLRSEAWIPIRIDPAKPAPVESDGVFIHREPPRLVLRAVHHGPAAAVESTFANLIRAVPGKGLRFAWPIWQVYLTDLTKTLPADQRVEARISVEPTGPTDVGIYVGRGAYPEFLPAISEAVGGGGVTIRPIDAEAILDGKLGKRCRALLMPGGWAGSYVEDLGTAGAKRIGEFVAKGNGYIGICAGAYFAAKRIDWEGKPLAYPLDLFPGVPTGPVKEIAAWPGYALTKVAIDPAHPITKGFPKERTVLYYGGPALTPKRGAKVKVLARYGGKGGGKAGVKAGDPAIVAFSRGRGRVFLTAVHLEMCLGRDREEYGWPAAEVVKPDPEPDRDLLRRGAEWVLRR